MEQEELERLVREILGDTRVRLRLPNYVWHEDLEAGRGRIEASVAIRGGLGAEADSPPVHREVAGDGVGLVDALFHGVVATLHEDYPSLDHIQFVDFTVSGVFSDGAAPAAEADARPSKPVEAGSDARSLVTLVVENTYGQRFAFQSESPSITGSSASAVLAAVEHFVNAELAVLRVHDWIDDAKRRSRPQLVERYTRRLADLVKNASYSDTIHKRLG